MKKTIVLICCFILSIFLLSACSDEKNVKVETNDQTTETVEYEDLELCGNDKISVKLNYIAKGKISLDITNKTNGIIDISDKGIAIDGQWCMPESTILYESLIPDTTTECIIAASGIKITQHESISGAFELGFEDGSPNEYLYFSEVALGYEKNPLYVVSESENVLYEDDELKCSFLKMDGTILILEITNKTNEYFSAWADMCAINGESFDVANQNPADIVSGCSGVLVLDIGKETEPGDEIKGTIQLYDIQGAGYDENQFSYSLTIEE